MPKVYEFNFAFEKHNGVGYMVARNTEELERLAAPFRVTGIISARRATAEDYAD